ncbi:hypothetical protein [Sanguibacter suaedae]|uniref:Uncharacterized protein n=1 Tax=Sanguibacter suaedae TaxID=2795737 RepID=A0A934M949_9MICO|nr:hypothetical protein [Sanguibacter suaedae]MBI9114268.1 hypothetical protein [Sanguibacter suaedae]
MIPPRWVWHLRDAQGDEMTEPRCPVFTNRFDAEQWLGESWRDLARQGASVAELYNDGTQAAAGVVLSTEVAPPPR